MLLFKKNVYLLCAVFWAFCKKLRADIDILSMNFYLLFKPENEYRIEIRLSLETPIHFVSLLNVHQSKNVFFFFIFFIN